MITIFKAVHYTSHPGQANAILKLELYTTREAAGQAVSRWAMQGSVSGVPWNWSIQNGRYECMIDEVLNYIQVEEDVVHDALKEENAYGELTITTGSITIRNEPIVVKQPSDCAHDNCPECQGTGQKKYGGMCVHHLVCHCRKCSPWCATPDYMIGSYIPNGYTPTTLVPEFDRDGSLISWQICRTGTKYGSGTYNQ